MDETDITSEEEISMIDLSVDFVSVDDISLVDMSLKSNVPVKGICMVDVSVDVSNILSVEDIFMVGVSLESTVAYSEGVPMVDLSLDENDVTSVEYISMLEMSMDESNFVSIENIVLDVPLESNVSEDVCMFDVTVDMASIIISAEDKSVDVVSFKSNVLFVDIRIVDV